MSKTNLNPIFIVTLAVIPLINVTKTLNEVVFLGLLVGLTYIIAISVVSIFEKLVDRNLRFFVFMIIATAIVTILNYVYSTFPNSLYTDAGSKINYCLVSAGILALQLIYRSRKDAGNYFFVLLIQVPLFLFIYGVFGFLRELLAYGSIWKINMGFSGLEFFRLGAASFIILAFICAFVNAYYLSWTKKKQQYELLVEKYKMKINVEHNDARVNVVDAAGAEFGAEKHTNGGGEQDE